MKKLKLFALAAMALDGFFRYSYCSRRNDVDAR